MKKILPVFIPFLGCPYRCLYCNQYTITGEKVSNFMDDVNGQVDNYLNFSRRWDEIAFFGGSFNLLEKGKRLFLYETAKKLKLPIRVSAYPKDFDITLIEEMKENNVKTVELGVQSFSNKVLKNNGRLYDCKELLDIINRLRDCGFRVGIQLMVGMYSENWEDIDINQTHLKMLKVDEIRIYPTVVFEGAKLYELFVKEGLSFEFHEVVMISLYYFVWAVMNGVNVLRIGLHNQKGLMENVKGGYFHPSFGDLLKTFAVYLYGKFKGETDILLFKNYPNYKGIIAKTYDVHYSEAVSMETICFYLWREYFEDNRWYIKGEIFKIAKEFISKTYN